MLISALVLSFAIGTIAAMRYHIQLTTEKMELHAAGLSVEMLTKIMKRANVDGAMESQELMVSKFDFVIGILDQLGYAFMSVYCIIVILPYRLTLSRACRGVWCAEQFLGLRMCYHGSW
jgi:hypothetical protein